MSTLLLDELKSGTILTQDFKIKRDISLEYIRLWVYKQNSLVDGTLTLNINDGATLLKSVEIDYTTINASTTLSYSHGYMRFDVSPLILRLGENVDEKVYNLTIELASSTYDGVNYIGIVRQWENKIYPTYGTGVVNNEAPNDFVEPYGIEFYEVVGV